MHPKISANHKKMYNLKSSFPSFFYIPSTCHNINVDQKPVFRVCNSYSEPKALPKQRHYFGTNPEWTEQTEAFYRRRNEKQQKHQHKRNKQTNKQPSTQTNKDINKSSTLPFDGPARKYHLRRSSRLSHRRPSEHAQVEYKH